MTTPAIGEGRGVIGRLFGVSRAWNQVTDTGESRIEATTTTGSDMSGRYVRIYPAYNCTIRWTLNGSKN